MSQQNLWDLLQIIILQSSPREYALFFENASSLYYHAHPATPSYVALPAVSSKYYPDFSGGRD